MRLSVLTITISFIHIMTVGKVQLRGVRNAVFQGIVEVGGQTESAIKHRINAGDKVKKDENAKTVASIFDNKFCILLDIEILESSLPLCQYGLDSRL